MVKQSNHRISLTLHKELYEKFEHTYPHCLSKFLRHCVEYALGDKDFFQGVFFHDMDTKLQDYCVNKMINRLDGVL